MRKAEEKWINGIREVLQQIFILIAVGSLFIFLPLQANRKAEHPTLPDGRGLTHEVSIFDDAGLKSFGSWLTRSLHGLGKGPGGNNRSGSPAITKK